MAIAVGETESRLHETSEVAKLGFVRPSEGVSRYRIELAQQRIVDPVIAAGIFGEPDGESTEQRLKCLRQ